MESAELGTLKGGGLAETLELVGGTKMGSTELDALESDGGGGVAARHSSKVEKVVLQLTLCCLFHARPISVMVSHTTAVETHGSEGGAVVKTAAGGGVGLGVSGTGSVASGSGVAVSGPGVDPSNTEVVDGSGMGVSGPGVDPSNAGVVDSSGIGVSGPGIDPSNTKVVDSSGMGVSVLGLTHRTQELLGLVVGLSLVPGLTHRTQELLTALG